jgi:O-antigen ligase
MRAGRPGASAAGRWIGIGAALALAAAVVRVNPMVVVQRFGSAADAAVDRLAIWRTTMPLIADFWLTGTGVGTFETAMLVYQPSGSPFRINAAHNHYLQVAAEGGALLTVATGVTLVAALLVSIARLREDHSGMYWMRAGALSGLAGVAAQSLFETGLTTPANGVLAAIAAAIAVHRAAAPHHG